MINIFLNKYSLGYKISLKGDNEIDVLLSKNKDIDYNIAILSKRLECKGIFGVRLDYLFTGDHDVITIIFTEYKDYLNERYMICESDEGESEEEIEEEESLYLDKDLEELVKPISEIIKSFWCNVCLKSYKNQKEFGCHFSKSKKHKSDKYVLEKKIEKLTKENQRLHEIIKKQEEEILKYKEKDKNL